MAPTRETEKRLPEKRLPEKFAPWTDHRLVLDAVTGLASNIATTLRLPAAAS
ncbi:hypothetical protein [Streptomyces sp. NPDC014734]|uniref:hypothetical protein n=1 Tax=Streptomyces sp. NPDC014734 TaxID=3364886 RepID=UPI0036FC7B0C